MKKRLLLLALPALMALSGCAGVSASPKANNLMVEDTLAHEEIFGEAVEAGEFGLRKAAPFKLATLTSDFVKMAYQIKFDDKGDGDASNDVISIRFIAAVKDAGVTAYWHRGFAQPNSWEGAEVSKDNWKFKFNDGIENQSEKMFRSLVGGPSTITAGAEGTEGWTDYAGFAIYTLMNIPYETYKDSYLAAYVTLTDADPENSTNTINSQGMVVKIEKNDGGTASKNRFYFDPNNTGHFLQGTINGVLRDGSNDSTNSLLRATEYDSGNYYAAYNNLAVDDEDSFGSFYFSPSHFQFFGKSDFFDGSLLYFDEAGDLNEYVSPKADGTYNLKVYSGSTPTENHVFTSSLVSGDSQNFVVKNIPNWVGDASAVLIANIEKNDSTWYYASLSFVRGSSESGDALEGTAYFTAPNNIKQFEILRCTPTTTTAYINWDDYSSNNAGRIWNLTNDKISVTGAGIFALTASSWKGH